MKTEDMPTGFVNCLRLHVFERPCVDSELVCKLRYLTELKIDTDHSAKDFYKVYTAIGAEGFCLKEFVTIK